MRHVKDLAPEILANSVNRWLHFCRSFSKRSRTGRQGLSKLISSIYGDVALQRQRAGHCIDSKDDVLPATKRVLEGTLGLGRVYVMCS
jgi:hypothetical protein